MKTVIVMLAILLGIANRGVAQQWQTVISLDSRVGYSTNTFLNSFLAEWNTGTQSPYSITSVFGKSYWYKDQFSTSITGGLFYEPVFGTVTDNWRGGVGLADLNYRLSNAVSLGVEGGGSFLKGNFSRSLSWVQPKITWFYSPFSLVRIKAGSNFRSYSNYAGSNSYDRYDLYALEFETWPSYQWQLQAGLYGNLNTLPDVQQGFNSMISAAYHFNKGTNIRFKTGLQQYQLSLVSNTGGSGGGPPGGGLPPNSGTSQTTTVNTDRIWRLGIDASIPLNERFSVFSSAEMLYYDAESSGISRTDYEVSAGVRFSFEPKFNTKRAGVTPDWEIGRSSQKISVNYSKGGQLYLVGTFNNWNTPGIPLSKQTDNTYVTTLSLSPGAYEYRLLRVQGNTREWLEFSNETYTVDDGFDSENAMILVE